MNAEKLVEEVRRGLKAADGEKYRGGLAGNRDDAVRALAALSQLEAILSEIGALPEKWRKAAPEWSDERQDRVAYALGVLTYSFAAELDRALQIDTEEKT